MQIAEVMQINRSIGGLEAAVRARTELMVEGGNRVELVLLKAEGDEGSLSSYFHRKPHLVSSVSEYYWAVRMADIVHIHSATASMWKAYSVVIPACLGKTVLLTLHLPSEPQKRSRLLGRVRAALQMLGRLLILRISRTSVFAPSLDAAGVAEMQFFRLVRVGALYNGVKEPEENLLKKRCRTVDESTSLRIICVGRLSDQKRPELVLEAFADALNSGLDLHLTFVGDGPLRPELECAIEQKNLWCRVRVLGFSSDPLQYISDSDVLVLGSESEGCPTVAMEAASVAVPTIALYSLEGMNEILPHAFFPVAGNTAVDLATAIKDVASLPAQDLMEVGRAARRQYERLFSLESTTAEYERRCREFIR